MNNYGETHAFQIYSSVLNLNVNIHRCLSHAICCCWWKSWLYV